jgi:DNA helicase II / ATP-dependent DNA helicase PcrA
MTDCTMDNSNQDDHVDDEIFKYLDIKDPKSFFMFAGAGSGKTRSLLKC